MEKALLCWPLDEYIHKKIVVEMQGGREVQGILKGYDQVGNLVLGECFETIPLSRTEEFTPRKFGTAVIRFPHILAINQFEEEEEEK